MRPLRWWAESAPHAGDRVKVFENLGATAVAPVAPADTSLYTVRTSWSKDKQWSLIGHMTHLDFRKKGGSLSIIISLVLFDSC